MALVTRISRLFQADFHAVLDRIEEPDLQLRQAVREMQYALEQDQQRLQLLQHEAEQLDKAARNAGEKLQGTRRGTRYLPRGEKGRPGARPGQAQARRSRNNCRRQSNGNEPRGRAKVAVALAQQVEEQAQQLTSDAAETGTCWSASKAANTGIFRAPIQRRRAQRGNRNRAAARKAAQEPVMNKPTLFDGVTVAAADQSRRSRGQPAAGWLHRLRPVVRTAAVRRHPGLPAVPAEAQ